MNQYAAMSTTPTAPIICDLRSDTVTRPDAAMRKAMADADVGDDVFGDDPTVNRLEVTLAVRLGKEAGVFLRVRESLRAVRRDAGLAVHLDGARYFNATAALNCPEQALADMFDSVSICLSKGLSAPIGSVLLGPADLLARARRWRKMLGGGMRQAGVLAAAGLHALEHNVARLSDDHARATALADALRAHGDVQYATNMIFFTPPGGVTDALPQHMAAHGVQLTGSTGTTRLVLHKDVTDEGLTTAINAFRSFFGG